jgi:hypothetical protein
MTATPPRSYARWRACASAANWCGAGAGPWACPPSTGGGPGCIGIAACRRPACGSSSKSMPVLLPGYGAGLRLLQCCRLRVQDVDFASNQVVVRTGKGDKDRVTMLPAVVKADLARHLEGVREQHGRDLQYGAGWVELPTALGRKYPNAGRECVSQWGSPQRASMWTGTPASGAGTTCTSPFSSAW